MCTAWNFGKFFYRVPVLLFKIREYRAYAYCHHIVLPMRSTLLGFIWFAMKVCRFREISRGLAVDGRLFTSHSYLCQHSLSCQALCVSHISVVCLCFSALFERLSMAFTILLWKLTHRERSACAHPLPIYFRGLEAALVIPPLQIKRQPKGSCVWNWGKDVLSI